MPRCFSLLPEVLTLQNWDGTTSQGTRIGLRKLLVELVPKTTRPNFLVLFQYFWNNQKKKKSQ